LYNTPLASQHILKMLTSCWIYTLTDLRLVGHHECIDSVTEWHHVFGQICALPKLDRLSLQIGCNQKAINKGVALNFSGLCPVMIQLNEFYISFDSRPGYFPHQWTNLYSVFTGLTHYRMKRWGLSLPAYNSELFHDINRALESA